MMAQCKWSSIFEKYTVCKAANRCMCDEIAKRKEIEKRIFETHKDSVCPGCKRDKDYGKKCWFCGN